MEKLPLCRICLIDDIDYLIEPTQLQNVYEKLTSIPFQTNDLRPQTMCYICYGKLQAINRFMLKCLKAETLLSQMLNCDNEVDLQAKIKRLIPKSYQMHTTVIEQNNIESDIDDDVIKHDIKHEPDDEMQDIYETEFVAIETDLVSQLKEFKVIHMNEDIDAPIRGININENIDDDDKNTYIRTSDANDNQQDNERNLFRRGKMPYKYCSVPQCRNTTIKTPNKLFVSVPKHADVRKKWMQLARKNPDDVSTNSNIFFCEDHFDMQKDIANYTRYKMGFSQRLLLVNGLMPSKFNCQEYHRKILCKDSFYQTGQKKMQFIHGGYDDNITAGNLTKRRYHEQANKKRHKYIKKKRNN